MPMTVTQRRAALVASVGGTGHGSRARALAATPLRLLLRIACFCATIVFCRPPPSRAAFAFKDETWEGTSEFAAIAREKLGKARVRIVSTLPWDEVQPVDAVLVLHPDRELDYREVAAFLAAGGRLGLLDDYGRGDALLRRFRIHRVAAPLDPKNPLRENPNLPIAVPVAAPDGRAHPVVAGVDRVVTNHPTGLETDPGLHLTTVLELPAVTEPPTALALIGVIGDASAVWPRVRRWRRTATRARQQRQAAAAAFWRWATRPPS